MNHKKKNSNHPDRQKETIEEPQMKPLEVETGNKKILILPAEIGLLFSKNKITRVQTLNGKRYIFNQPLKQTGEMLDNRDFFQANRQVIINRNHYQRLPATPQPKTGNYPSGSGLF